MTKYRTEETEDRLQELLELFESELITNSEHDEMDELMALEPDPNRG